MRSGPVRRLLDEMYSEKFKATVGHNASVRRAQLLGNEIQKIAEMQKVEQSGENREAVLLEYTEQMTDLGKEQQTATDEANRSKEKHDLLSGLLDLALKAVLQDE